MKLLLEAKWVKWIVELFNVGAKVSFILHIPEQNKHKFNVFKKTEVRKESLCMKKQRNHLSGQKDK